jgi:hypothetical protein
MDALHFRPEVREGRRKGEREISIYLQIDILPIYLQRVRLAL